MIHALFVTLLSAAIIFAFEEASPTMTQAIQQIVISLLGGGAVALVSAAVMYGRIGKSVIELERRANDNDCDHQEFRSDIGILKVKVATVETKLEAHVDYEGI